MTYGLAVWEGDPPSGDDQAAETFEWLLGEVEESDAPPTPRIRGYVEALLSRWPDLDDDSDDSPWGDGPLMDNAVGGTFLFSVLWSRAEEAVAYCAELAAAHGLVCFDPQEERLLTK
jgi:hypothetical protein